MDRSPFTPYPPPPQDPLPDHIPQGFLSLARTLGLHPLVALLMFLLDHMLFFTLEVPTFGALVVVSVIVGAASVLPMTLIQRYAYGDPWGAALGKGLAVGILTGVPTSLPSALTAGWGLLGLAGMIGGGRRPPPGPQPEIIDMPPG